MSTPAPKRRGRAGKTVDPRTSRTPDAAGADDRSFESQADPGDGTASTGVGVANLTRAGLVEMVGSFFLIYTGTATAVAATLGKNTGGSPPDSLAIALAFGFVLAAMVGALGHISGAHLNPAVTLGLAVIGKFSWKAVPTYVVFQLLGATLGALATWASFGGAARSTAKLGAPAPAEGISDLRAFLVETFITFLLVFVVIAVTSDRRAGSSTAAVAIGFALVSAVLIGGPSTGGAVNPVRALGPEIASSTFTSFWVYLLAPIVGGIAAALVYDKVIGRATTPA
jgi:MIP family channel proteins